MSDYRNKLIKLAQFRLKDCGGIEQTQLTDNFNTTLIECDSCGEYGECRFIDGARICAICRNKKILNS